MLQDTALKQLEYGEVLLAQQGSVVPETCSTGVSMSPMTITTEYIVPVSTRALLITAIVVPW